MLTTPCETRRHESRCGGLFFGGSLIILGAAFLLDRLGMLGGINPWHVWPTLIIWGALLKIVDSRHSGSIVSGLVFLLIGAALQAHYLGVLPLELRNLWPIGLMALGSLILVGSIVGRRRRVPLPAMNVSSEGTLNRSLTFSGREERVTTRAFKGGNVSCTFGGLKLDLSGADIEAEEAIIDLDIVMGGLELRVPRHWRVIVEASPMLGGVEDHSALDDVPGLTKRLVLRGRIVMGGVEIKN